MNFDTEDLFGQIKNLVDQQKQLKHLSWQQMQLKLKLLSSF
jgi:hypothetical protein